MAGFSSLIRGLVRMSDCKVLQGSHYSSSTQLPSRNGWEPITDQEARELGMIKR